MLRLIALATVVSYAWAATTVAPTRVTHHTHRPHSTREPSEHDSFKFAYDSFSHDMVVVNGHTCYVFTLTDDERVAVHTDDGIKALELKLLGLLSTGTQTETTRDALNKHEARLCGNHITHFYTVA